ncbi:TlpA family protein disulfide reductase [Actinoplanes utahensis]|uniref:Thiol:disulfide interchange protein n=1 Tax=Actinoplanes utahensis TaxID=1869 RepID=A0A0A6U8M5_ACTUT|nr:TlpA disulfide reductase family protein [Actinoplanes utahensis]KHD72400.1 thiol:disulfide interchange protein [Actinoplanes utahensis]GIF29517.1 cytochrome c biogenesis protein [Actinoplanes utahensis]
MKRLLAAIAAVLLLSGCTAAVDPDEPEIPSPFALCDGLTTATPAASEIPDISLRCFTGGADVRLRDLRGPAVINLWASWCGPCRDELPVIQGLADRAQGRFTVIGVNTGDSRNKAASFAADHAVTFPTLFDQDKRLLGALRTTMLPATVFIDADGRMDVHRAAMDVDQVIEQVKKHFGVTVTR